jgi:heptosyltransferase-2
MHMQEYRNILVHSLVNLGDVLLTTSAVALLRKKYPDAKITMMVRPMAAEILRNNPIIDEVIIYDYRGKDKPVSKMLRLMKDLRARRFDMSISFDRKLRPALLCILAGITVRVGPDRVFADKSSWITKLYTHTITIPHDIVSTHQAETYQAIVRGFTGCHDVVRPVIGSIMPEHQQKTAALLRTLPTSKVKIGLCVKGTFALKNWSQQRFAQVVDRLAMQYNAAFFIVGAPEDNVYASEVIGKTNTTIANFCGQTSLMDLATLLQQSDLFITVDTGATHIGAVVGVPMVVIYGCTSPKRWHPISDKATTISTNEPCCPCTIPEDACAEHRCMQGIGVAQVIDEVEKIFCSRI